MFLQRILAAKSLERCRSKGLLTGSTKVHFHGRATTIDQVLGWLQVMKDRQEEKNDGRR